MGALKDQSSSSSSGLTLHASLASGLTLEASETYEDLIIIDDDEGEELEQQQPTKRKKDWGGGGGLKEFRSLSSRSLSSIVAPDVNPKQRLTLSRIVLAMIVVVIILLAVVVAEFGTTKTKKKSSATKMEMTTTDTLFPYLGSPTLLPEESKDNNDYTTTAPTSLRTSIPISSGSTSTTTTSVTPTSTDDIGSLPPSSLFPSSGPPTASPSASIRKHTFLTDGTTSQPPTAVGPGTTVSQSQSATGVMEKATPATTSSPVITSKPSTQASRNPTMAPTSETPSSSSSGTPTTANPTSGSPTTGVPTTVSPTSSTPTETTGGVGFIDRRPPTTTSPTSSPTTASPTPSPTTVAPTTATPTTAAPTKTTTASPTTLSLSAGHDSFYRTKLAEEQTCAWESHSDDFFDILDLSETHLIFELRHTITTSGVKVNHLNWMTHFTERGQQVCQKVRSMRRGHSIVRMADCNACGVAVVEVYTSNPDFDSKKDVAQVPDICNDNDDDDDAFSSVLGEGKVCGWSITVPCLGPDGSQNSATDC